ncbi:MULTISPECIES: Fic family protein [Bradyrhizobium]|uniref:Fic family protein n=1 Tax=Bradyrhizobium elkanii TaxID=29448 RepID=UPI0034E58827
MVQEKIDPIIKAAIAHLWFVTIHPFEDGNGRIARAVADMSLARSENSPQRFYSMSAQIRVERKNYYDMLESTQKGDLDITPWLEWFLGCLDRAFAGAETILAAVLVKADFWKKIANVKTNERQRDISPQSSECHSISSSSRWRPDLPRWWKCAPIRCITILPLVAKKPYARLRKRVWFCSPPKSGHRSSGRKSSRLRGIFVFNGSEDFYKTRVALDPIL